MYRPRSYFTFLILLAFYGHEIESQYSLDLRSQKVDFLKSGVHFSDVQVSAQETSSILTIERLKSCGKRDLCQGRKNHHLQPPLYGTGNIWGGLMCFCDDNCTAYGDCCIDKVLSDNPVETPATRSLQGCIPTGHVLGVIGLISCNGDSKLAELCVKTNSSNVQSDIAVFSRTTGTVYANVYCALCHSVKPADIEFANYTAKCVDKNTKIENLEYKNLTWVKQGTSVGVKSQSTAKKCRLELGGFPAETRRCYPGQVDSCPSTQADQKQACELHSLPVRNDKTNTEYKNPYCALCHGETIENISCITPLRERFGSLAIIMDFDWDFNTCQWPQTLWDGLTQSCLPLDCDQDTCFIKLPDLLDYDQALTQEHLTQKLAEDYITLLVLLLSIFLLILHNIIYYLEPKRQNVPSQILKNLSWSIILGHISFLFVDTKFSVPPAICKFIGLSTQFFYCASFFWMNVMSYDVWRTFSKVSLRGSSSNVIKKYNSYAWGCPLIILILTFFSDTVRILPENFRPHIGFYKICWFSDKLVLAIYFFLPIFVVLITNLYFFGKTVFWFQKQTSKEFERVNNEASGRKEYRKIWLYIKLSVIMGLTWLFGIASALTHIQALRYIFIICNGLQGAMIFIMFDMKKATLHQVVDSFKSRTSWSSSASDARHFQTKETTSTHITRNLTSMSLKLNMSKK